MTQPFNSHLIKNVSTIKICYPVTLGARTKKTCGKLR